MIIQYSVSGTIWTPVSSVGENIKAWLDEDNDGAVGRVDVRIVNSDEGIPSSGLTTEGKRLYHASGNDDVYINNASSADDIFYIKCANVGDEAIVSVDTSPSNYLKAVDIAIQDQVSDPLDWYMSRLISSTNLTNPISITDQGDYFEVVETCEITIDSTSGVAVGLWLEMWEGLFKYQGEIEAINGNVLTMGLCIGFPFSINAVVRIVDIDQNKDFTVGGIGEQCYSIDPPDIYTGDLHQNRFMISMLHAAQSDSGTYGDIIGGISPGIAVSGRGKLLTEESGLGKPLVIFNNLLNIKTNIDWKQTAYDVSYDDKGGNPASNQLYGTSVRKSFNGQDKSGVAIPVIKDRNEATRALFRADLSSLSLHRIKSIGHLVI